MDEKQVLRSFLSAVHPLPKKVMDDYISAWKIHRMPKRTLMTSEGEVERYMYFVLEGIQKSYYLNEGKQHIIAFTYSPSFSGIPESFLTQSPSPYFLSTISESVFLRISYDKHQEMLEKHWPIERLFRKATEALLIGTLHRYYSLMAFDIETRFRQFTQRSPHLLQLVSQKDLASYLRIDPSNFSKLMNRIKI